MQRIAIGLLLAFVATSAVNAEDSKGLNVKMKTLDGKEVNLAKKYKGKVLLVVNVASRCGLTPQYNSLQALHKEYKGKGLCVLGFPCNQFGAQEPGTADEIKKFCSTEYGVDFDMFAKIDVNGKKACALYKHLTAQDTKPKGAGNVSWNFEKFLVGRDGKVVARFSPGTKPNDKKVLDAIATQLEKK